MSRLEIVMTLHHALIPRAVRVGCLSIAIAGGTGCDDAGAKALGGRSEPTDAPTRADVAPAYARLDDALCDPAGGCAAAPRPLSMDVLVKDLVKAPAARPSVEAAAPPVGTGRPKALPPLDGKPFVALPVPGFEDAVVALPTGATDRAPVVVAMHGSFDKPEPFCATWAKIFQNKAFVVCPRGMLAPGSPWGDKRFTFVEEHSAEREIDASLAALHGAPYAAYVDAEKPVYAGFSLGAFMGVPLARRRGNDFSSMIFVAANLDHMSRAMLEDFVETGGQRLMLVCAEGKEALHVCSNQAGRIVQRLEGMGGQGVVVDAGRAGHAYDGKVAKALTTAIPSFLGGDPRFASLQSADDGVVPASVTTR